MNQRQIEIGLTEIGCLIFNPQGSLIKPDDLKRLLDLSEQTTINEIGRRTFQVCVKECNDLSQNFIVVLPDVKIQTAEIVTIDFTKRAKFQRQRALA